MNADRLLAILRDLDAVLTAARRRLASAEDVRRVLWELTGHCCGRGDEVGGRALNDWCAVGHSLRALLVRDPLGPRRERAKLAECRRRLAPLFAWAAEARKQLEAVA